MKPTRRKRIVLGIDEQLTSRVAASVLRNQDCDLFALHLHCDLEKLGLDEKLYPSALRRSNLPAIEKFCESLGIFYRVIDVTEKVLAEVYDPFWIATLQGLPDAPSLRWNSRVLLPELSTLAESVGAETIATGHFAGAMSGIQTYFEPRLNQAGHFATVDRKTISRLMLPMGEVMPEMVMRLAREIGAAPNADAKDEKSPAVPSDDLAALLELRESRATWRWDPAILSDPQVQARAAGDFFRPGPIRSTEQLSLGDHLGLPLYRIGDAAPEYEGQYVLETQAQSRTLVIGPPEGLARNHALLNQIEWLDSSLRPIYGERLVQVEVLDLLEAAKSSGRARRTNARLHEFPDRIGELLLDAPLYFSPGHRLLFLEESRLLGSARVVEIRNGD